MSVLEATKQALPTSSDDDSPRVKLVVLGAREAVAEVAMAVQQPLYLQDHADHSAPDGCRCHELFYIGCWDGQLAPQAFDGAVIRTGDYPVTRRNGEFFESHGLRPHGPWWRLGASFECNEKGADTLLLSISRAHPDVLVVAAYDDGDHSWEMRVLSGGHQFAVRLMQCIERDDWHDALPVDLTLLIDKIGTPILEQTAARAPGGPGWRRWSPIAVAATAGPAELARAVHAAATAAGYGMQHLLQAENAKARRLGVASALDVLLFDAADAADELPYTSLTESGCDDRCRAVLDFLAQHRAAAGPAADFARALAEHLADPLVKLRSGLLAMPYLAWAANDSAEHGAVLTDINTRMSRRLRDCPGLLQPANDVGRRIEGSIMATTLHLLGDHGSVELALAAGVAPQIVAVSLRDITDPGTTLRGLLRHFGSALALPHSLLAHLPQLGDELASALAALRAEERMRARIDEVASDQLASPGDVLTISTPQRRHSAL